MDDNPPDRLCISSRRGPTDDVEQRFQFGDFERFVLEISDRTSHASQRGNVFETRKAFRWEYLAGFRPPLADGNRTPCAASDTMSALDTDFRRMRGEHRRIIMILACKRLGRANLETLPTAHTLVLVNLNDVCHKGNRLQHGKTKETFLHFIAKNEAWGVVITAKFQIYSLKTIDETKKLLKFKGRSHSSVIHRDAVFAFALPFEQFFRRFSAKGPKQGRADEKFHEG